MRTALALLLLTPFAPFAPFAPSPPHASPALPALLVAWLDRESTSWDGLDALPGIKWAPLPPASLKNCLPDGGCFARQGSLTTDGLKIAVMATGARTIVMNLYLRNSGAPLGADAILKSLPEAGITATLARCPIKGTAGRTRWYRLAKGDAKSILAIQPGTLAKPNEGYVLTDGDALPQLQPDQLALYSEQCAPGAEPKPVSNVKPVVAVADVVTSLLVPASATGLTWAELEKQGNGITWNGGGPKRMDFTTLKNDPNPMGMTGSATWAGRSFSLMASGTATQVKVIYLDEGGRHPKGEHMLGVVYEKGIAVKLVRCGPVYTESTNNWYSLTSKETKPAMILQSIHYDGNMVADSYALRLDGTLPSRDPRDRDPGVGGCQ